MTKHADDLSEYFAKKKLINVNINESYDDSNVSDYERVEYEMDDESCPELTKQDVELVRDVLPSYDVKPREEMIKIFTRIAQTLNSKKSSEYEKQAAESEGLSYLDGMIKKVMYTKFKSYIINDPSFKDDLYQEASYKVITGLSRYDGSKNISPSTYFYIYILSGMANATNMMKNDCISSSDAALMRKMRRIEKRAQESGHKATLYDYMVETSKSPDKIEDMLIRMNSKIGHLDAMDQFDSYIAGDAGKCCDYENPESTAIRNVIADKIIKRLKHLCMEDELQVFLMNKLENIDVPEIARRLHRVGDEDVIRRTIRAVASSAEYDPVIRRLGASFGYCKDYENKDKVTLINLFSQEENMQALAPKDGKLE